ncbi:hypothetical protein NVP2044O_33 [Vibrio phage 2.044.O._10N.261.51.B8]|nr:hypothetical protein NVP2044O_33 [Vibrio phage 2.044.O._10N.261.51.B8]
MKIVFKANLVEHVEKLNKTQPVQQVYVSHNDVREVIAVYRSRHGENNWVNDENSIDCGYPGATLETLLNGILYTPQDNMEDYRG